MNDGRRIVGTTAVGVGDLSLLATLRPDAGDLARELAAPHAWVAAAGADGAALTLAGAALWCVALWLGVGLLAALAAALPGGCGRVARWLARALLPTALYRVVAGAAGLGVLLAPVAAGAAGTDAPAGRFGGATTSLSGTPIPSPTWPSDPPTLPAPGWPTAVPSPAPSAVPRPAARPAQPTPRGGVVVVRPGDSLWAVAAAQLGRDATPARTAAAWPRWYTANRALIGADPDLIRPGQRLTAPASSGDQR